jgi:hypothetical protein
MDVDCGLGDGGVVDCDGAEKGETTRERERERERLGLALQADLMCLFCTRNISSYLACMLVTCLVRLGAYTHNNRSMCTCGYRLRYVSVLGLVIQPECTSLRNVAHFNNTQGCVTR